MILTEEEYLMHYGIPRKSGRYPWGSGEDPKQSIKEFLDHVKDLKAQGLTDVEIAKDFGMTTTELRADKSIARNFLQQEKLDKVRKLTDAGYSNGAIAKMMGLPNESSVRSLQKQAMRDQTDKVQNIANLLRDNVDKHGMVDVGSGVENWLGISRTRLDTAIASLRHEDYKLINVQEDQLGTTFKTTRKVLAKPGTTYVDVVKNKEKIHTINVSSPDKGKTFMGILPPLSISSKRLEIKYSEDGGDKADGLIYVRPGVKDISLGKSNYAQVRIAIDGTHYIKGMAIYKEGLPPGTDLVFNTSKSNKGDKLLALKPMNLKDPENPFGALVKQIYDTDAKGNRTLTSAMNVVNPQGRWEEWNKSLSSQMLSKQSRTLAKAQLDETYRQKKEALDEILSLTNPTVRAKLLENYSDGVDAAALHLKAAHLPRQSTHVILPINSLKDTEVYATKFNDGERVVLIRFPHGGIFEIPELTVNNRNREAKKLLGDAQDAIGINHKVASQLSGADFDGDTVLVIPNNDKRIATAPALADLKKFDPKTEYPLPEGVKFKGNKQQMMGDVSNLITDMTIKGANVTEIAKAVRHSMVIIDAEKHDLDYKKSARDNNIALLKTRYQNGPRSGASTIVSRKKTEIPIPERRLRSSKRGGPIDPKTGKLVYEETGRSYVDKKTGKTVTRMSRVKKLELVDDANELSSGTPIEKLYADHSNRLKDLANKARFEMYHTKPNPTSESAKKIYANEVASLNVKLDLAKRNRPLERAAQALGQANFRARQQANPNMDAAELKKIKFMALEAARATFNAHKPNIYITDTEWAAIQAGAISNTKLKDILNNADMTRVKQLATPRHVSVMSTQDAQRARAMKASGQTLAEIAGALGVSVTTLQTTLKGDNNG